MRELHSNLAENRLRSVEHNLRCASGVAFNAVVDDELTGIQAYAVYESRNVELSPELADALNDDALAWVIAHEVAHLELDHQARLVESRDRHDEAFQKGLGELATKVRRGEGRFLRDMTTRLGLLANWSVGVLLDRRNVEREADSRAVELALEAGYGPEGAFEALIALEREDFDASSYRLGRHIANILQDHPLTEVRIARLKRRLVNQD